LAHRVLHIPTKDVPAQQTPTKDVPAQQTPTKDVPAQQTPTKDVPAQQTPPTEAQQTPPTEAQQTPPTEAQQTPPTDEQIMLTMTKDGLKNFIESILKIHSGYKVRRLSYGSQIGVIWLTAFVIAFLAYSEIWIITHNVIMERVAAQDPALFLESMPYGLPSSSEYVGMITNFNFWFGFTLLLFPVGMYVFSFLIYIDMLFDGRVIEISNILNQNPNLSKKFFQVYWNRFERIFDEEVDKLERKSRTRGITWSRRLGAISKSSKNRLYLPEEYFSAKDSNYLGKKAEKKKAVTMTELLERLSERMDGSTIKGYFYAFILLQVVVSILFVIPAIEFSGLGSIGTDLLTHVSGAAKGETTPYVSFWAIEWAVFGAFVYSFVTLMDRIPRRDVTPRYYLNIALRYIFAVALSSLFFLLVNQIGISAEILKGESISYYGIVAALSFTIGMFPNRYFKILAIFVSEKIVRSSTRDIPLEKLTGISSSEATRFWEEGIENVDQLADQTVNSLYKKTRFDPNRLRNLTGRALMWKYIFGLDNMYIILGKHNKEESGEVSEIVKEVRDCKFADVASLLYYIFSKPIEKISSTDTKKIMNDENKLRNISTLSGLNVGRLRGAISMTEYFGRQLHFVDSEMTISDIVEQVLSGGKGQESTSKNQNNQHAAHSSV
jgi:hypothetical protein